MFYNILDEKRLKLLPLFKSFKADFYLGGGTALALQIGHRDSIDFDFFGPKELDTKKLFVRIKEVFSEQEVLKIQEEADTLTALIAGVKISFFGYPYGPIDEIIEEENIRLASVKEIGCMKLSAITGRASNKDYIDLYYILQKTELKDLLQSCFEKFPDLDRNLILKSLVYFKDVGMEAIAFKNNNHVDFEEVEEFLIKEVKKIEIK